MRIGAKSTIPARKVRDEVVENLQISSHACMTRHKLVDPIPAS